MRFKQGKRIVNFSITSHFSYYRLVWMFHSRRLHNCIGHIHERAFGTIYQDYNSSFKQLLSKESSLTKLFKSNAKNKSHFAFWKILDLRSFAVRKGVLRNFAKFTGKHLCQSFFFNDVSRFSLQLHEKRGSGTSVFLWIFRNF